MNIEEMDQPFELKDYRFDSAYELIDFDNNIV
eukprot:CAMPEP_0116870148 /NCGR_PEP_ID=MMETSP0463-20121206/9_1 /TAXON_ID=181622 /ORGANISM="Strombidinopsis sp, Strain SopsisLIS2011" /LENGTH=31 /DNA_ID= /DNA_START= /DNA_END= /DNA_ORIENTATION=